MGPLLFPVFAFILWEFPSMVLMALHKATCALTGIALLIWARVSHRGA
ncbi:hypothetical protein AB0M54_14475 [Actinoplanes sp. NPDC051470]